jgi:hypothetical protein
MKKKYRIWSSRPDDLPILSDAFEANPANNDEEARKKLFETRTRPSNDWDRLSLERVDVEEKVTHIADSEIPAPVLIKPPSA